MSFYLPYTTPFQIYGVLKVLYVVLYVYHTQHTFKYMLCSVGGLPYTTHLKIYVAMEVLDVVLYVYHT